MGKTLVAYFSASGTTRRRAEEFQKLLDADLYEIKPAKPYTTAELDWTNPKSRSSVEMKDPASRPELAESAPDLSAYDAVYIGFPIWWYTAPHIINSFLESGDFSGKKIALFSTSGGTGIQGAADDLKKQYPNLTFAAAKSVNRGVEELL
ncbi:MAG: flavodoxin [Eubacteriales bacterium]|nr:flavodoxin [Eubacteriales bacterium]